MAVLLQDTSGGTWAVTANTDGTLVTTMSSGLYSTVRLNDENGQTWRLGVTVAGLLVTTATSYFPAPRFVNILDSLEQIWVVSVSTDGFLQDILGLPDGVLSWIPNGFGAATDNSFVGGGGGYMAYPQPLQSGVVSINPEQNGQCAPLNFTFDTEDILFEIVNPGRNG